MFESIASFERIAFQTESSLAKKLVGICNDFLTWVETTRVTLPNGKIPIATSARLKAAKKYGNDVFGPKVQQLLTTELNMNTIVMCHSDNIFNCMMVPMFKNVDWMDSEIGQDFFSGTSSYGNTEFNPTLFDSLDTTIDLTKSAFTTKPSNYLMQLHLFVYTYLGKETNSTIVPWTAEEHAAAILHECGHAISIYEHMADVYHRADIAGNSIRYLSENADDTTAITTLSTLETAVKQHPNTECFRPFDTIIVDIKKTPAQYKCLNPVIFGIALTFLGLLASTFVSRLMEAGRFGTINSSSHKSSDLVITESNAGYNERIADEFVSRHGLGAALASVLKKLDTIGAARSGIADAINAHTTIKVILGSLGFLISTFGMLFYINDTVCDPILLRLEHILHNNMVVFKDDSLSDELRVYFVNDTKDLLKTISDIKKTNGFKIRQLFWGTIMRILSRGSVLDGLRTASLSSDYDILQQLSNNLIKNPLFYHAARLKNL